MKILIVDDEPLIRRSLERAFQSKGHQVILAEDGKKGLDLWMVEKPELVLLDVLMPGLSGPEVLARIGTAHSAKVVLMSAHSGEHNMGTAQKMGANAFIPKPFDDIFELISQVERLVHE